LPITYIRRAYIVYTAIILIYNITKMFIHIYLLYMEVRAMGEALELEPFEGRLRVLLVEKEYDEPFWLVEPTEASREKNHLFKKPSKAFLEFVKKLVEIYRPHVATEELGVRSENKFYKFNPLAELFKELGLPFYPADIHEYARSYLASRADRLRERIEEIAKALKEAEERKDEQAYDYLLTYGQYLQGELENEIAEVEGSVRDAWIAKGIIDAARKVGKKDVTCLHICSPKKLDSLAELLISLGADVQIVRLEKKVSTLADESLAPIEVEVRPMAKVVGKTPPRILYFFSTDEVPSPFDINMAYDAGFDVIVPYARVDPDRARVLVQDAMFSRKVKDVKRMCFFISGRDLEAVEAVVDVIRDTMFPPFECPVIVDPRGAYTTAASIVAKAEKVVEEKGFGKLGNQTCAVFGTGPVGRIVAVLLAKMGAKVLLVEPWEKMSQQYVDEVADKLRRRYGVSVESVFAPNKADRLEVLKRATVIFTVAAPGVRIIDKSMLSELRFSKVFIDANAKPPTGVEGLELQDDGREIAPGIYGVGALAIGRLKYKVEMYLLRQAIEKGRGIFGLDEALNLAEDLVKGKTKVVLPKVKLVLSWSGKS